MDWLDIFRACIAMLRDYFGMYFVFGGVKITVASVFVFVGLVGFVVYIIRGMSA